MNAGYRVPAAQEISPALLEQATFLVKLDSTSARPTLLATWHGHANSADQLRQIVEWLR